MGLVEAIFEDDLGRDPSREAPSRPVEREHGRPTNAIRARWKSTIAGVAGYYVAKLLCGQASGGEHDQYMAMPPGADYSRRLTSSRTNARREVLPAPRLPLPRSGLLGGAAASPSAICRAAWAAETAWPRCRGDQR